MKYQDDSFGVGYGSKDYRDNFEATFGKRCPACGERMAEVEAVEMGTELAPVTIEYVCMDCPGD